MKANNPKSQKRDRFAIYTRYSSDLQNELSLEAQEYRCRQAVLGRGGVVVSVFSDGAKSGWNLERDGFKELCHAAKHGKFDAVIFWKFDRLARNHDHAVMIKLLLRREYGLKLYCVEGFSEDEDDSPYTALMEQMLAVFAAFYSRNLSNETKRGKFQRALRGEYNGSVPPLGYVLVTKAQATPGRPAGLYILLRVAAVVRRAFFLYATGCYSDMDIADWLNRQRVIQKMRTGKPPIGKEMVRDMLQNRIYTGRVPYAETHYSGSLGQGKQSSRGRRQWFEGKHQGFVTDELFDRCQEIREIMSRTKKVPARLRTYLLHDRLFCLRCMCLKPTELTHTCYGKMRPSFDNRRQSAWYRCYARDRGYQACGQSYTNEQMINDQVVTALAQLCIPDAVHTRIERALKAQAQHTGCFEQIAELQEAISRLNFSWEQGCLGVKEYLDRRQQLEQEILALRPLAHDSLTEAEDLLRHFTRYWEACAGEERPEVAQKKLLAKIVDKVFVYDHIVVGISLHKDYGLILDTADLTLSDLVTSVRRKQASAGLEIHSHVQQGKPRGGTGQSGVLSQPFVWAHQFESYQPIVKALLPA